LRIEIDAAKSRALKTPPAANNYIFAVSKNANSRFKLVAGPEKKTSFLTRLGREKHEAENTPAYV
jgi:hypothetical protein